MDTLPDSRSVTHVSKTIMSPMLGSTTPNQPKHGKPR